MTLKYVLLLAWLALASSALADDLPLAVRDALRQAHIPLGSVGIVVREVNSSTPLIQINARQSIPPRP